jgi:hypothetical protein
MKRYFFYFLFVMLSLTSCLTKIVLKSIGVFETTVPLKYISNGSKQLVFLSMHHAGTAEFYKDEERIIDSLTKIGYSVFYEAVKPGNVNNKLDYDTLRLKFRSITGLPRKSATQSSQDQFVDTINNTIMGRKTNLVKKYKLKNQSIDYLKKYDTSIVKNVDASLLEMVNIFQKKYGVIKLQQKDFDTKLGDDYPFKKNKELYKFFVQDSRNEIITNTILNSNTKKIALIYGAGHFNGILQNLKAADNNYKEVQKF